jgi:hypothetical protein
MGETLVPLTVDLCAVVAAMPPRNRESAFAEILRILRREVKAIDRFAIEHLRLRSKPAGRARATASRASRKVRVGIDDLEGRVIPSIMTITLTNHQSPVVQPLAPVDPNATRGLITPRQQPVLPASGPSSSTLG